MIMAIFWMRYPRGEYTIEVSSVSFMAPRSVRKGGKERKGQMKHRLGRKHKPGVNTGSNAKACGCRREAHPHMHTRRQ